MRFPLLTPLLQLFLGDADLDGVFYCVNVDNVTIPDERNRSTDLGLGRDVTNTETVRPGYMRHAKKGANYVSTVLAKWERRSEFRHNKDGWKFKPGLWVFPNHSENASTVSPLPGRMQICARGRKRRRKGGICKKGGKCRTKVQGVGPRNLPRIHHTQPRPRLCKPLYMRRTKGYFLCVSSYRLRSSPVWVKESATSNTSNAVWGGFWRLWIQKKRNVKENGRIRETRASNAKLREKATHLPSAKPPIRKTSDIKGESGTDDQTCRLQHLRHA